ncbi:MAG TPA: hypothetical protein H9834_01800, partial [Candidatus Barnesiella excrementavium]|nr:hypothetical protein [Candidatus Barnesiella excrementavium]
SFFSLVLHLLLFSLVNELYLSAFPGPCRPLSSGESVAKVHPFSFPFQIFEQLFFKNFSEKIAQFIQLFYLLVVINSAAF